MYNQNSTDENFFIEIKNGVLFLIRNETISVLNDYHLKRHCLPNHAAGLN